MATLVFSTIGTALGGPVGSAIGALVGQSIDQQILSPVRRGPRVGDLSVQTSSYGTQVPRIFGTMRVAGSVIWSTDLIENEGSDGAKGQPDVTYSYSVSLAVAVSSRPIRSIKRIWADGKLIRGAAGDFKVPTKFRLHIGDEDQAADPFIASSEGVASTPAYRGLAVCVFEDLQLSEFGNRIPFLTFEVEADDGPVPVGRLVDDVSQGLINVENDRTLVGYAAYGRAIRDAAEPLIEAFDVLLFDDGERLRWPTPAPVSPFSLEDLGNSADDKAVSRCSRELVPASALPVSLRLTYYDPARDYQTGEARCSVGEPGSEVQHDLPVVLSADAAKGLANEMLARAWADRDRMTIHLPIANIDCEPGTLLRLPFAPTLWRVQSVSIEGYVAIVGVRPVLSALISAEADGGRIAANPDLTIGPVSLALFDIPDPITVATEPRLFLAATSPGEGWKSQTVELLAGDQRSLVQTSRKKSVLGRAVSILGPGTPFLLDLENSFEIELIDRDQWLTSCDEVALAAGANAAVLGRELLQFGKAEPLGSGRFRLSRLLRGRAGTEWACGNHEENDMFCLLGADIGRWIALSPTVIGATAKAAIDSKVASLPIRGEGVRPLSPINLMAAVEPDGGLTLRWARRSRAGLAWIDGVDAPLAESQERYRVRLVAADNAVEWSTAEPAATIDPATVSGLGAGPISISVEQVGDYATSPAATLILD